MEALALYLIKSTVWLTGFALVYLLFLRNERFFLLNRIYLVSGIIVSIVFPFFTWHYTVMIPNTPTVRTVEVSDLQMTGTVVLSEPFPTQALLLYIYLAGALYLLYRVIRQTRSVLRVIRKSEILPYRSAKLIRTTEYPASFSFFSFVFVNPSTCDTETNEIVNHELEHIRQQHWIDLLLFEILCTLQWYNPMSWLYGRFIRQNHEYLADERALQRTTNPAIYRAALLNQLFGGPVITLSNSFNYSINKKRFNMMKQTIYSPIRKLKLLLILPFMAGVFYAFAMPEYKYATGNEDQKPLYTIAQDKIDIPFTNQLDKNDLEAIKADLAKLGVIIDYTYLDFSENGKLKQISASVKNQEGSIITFTSGKLDPTYYPRFWMESNGRIGVYNQRSINGKVISEDGNPLKGASVIISGTTIGTTTDVNGNFILEMKNNSPLDISYIGFGSQKVIPEFGQEMLITMKPKMIGFDEIIVTAGTETSKVQINSLPQIHLADGSKISHALIVIDGVITENQNVNNIPPETIESINVLKGESATAMYGDKGKNGVVEITLKKNKKTTYSRVQFGCADGSIITDPLIVIDGNITDYQTLSNNKENIIIINTLNTESGISKYGDKGKNGAVEAIRKTGKFAATSKKEIVKNESGVYSVVEQMPEFPGGVDALRTFIAANVKYPALAHEKGIQGKVYIQFVVTQTGKVSDAKVVRGVHASLDQEAIRVVESLPNWTSGKQNGENVDVSYTIPIDFKLEPSKISTEKLRGTDTPSEQPYSVVEQMPEFPGGAEAWRYFIARNVKYPALAHEKGIEGKVYINFVVSKTGIVTDAKVVRGDYPSLDKEVITVTASSVSTSIVSGGDPSLDREALRVIKSLPTWKPGKQNGENVDVEFTIPISFEIEIAPEKEIKPQAEPTVLKNNLVIVPNPTQDKATITLVGSDSTNKLEVSIIDSFGKLISKESKNGPSFTLSVAKLTTGTYLVIASDGTTQYQGHLVVNH